MHNNTIIYAGPRPALLALRAPRRPRGPAAIILYDIILYYSIVLVSYAIV